MQQIYTVIGIPAKLTTVLQTLVLYLVYQLLYLKNGHQRDHTIIIVRLTWYDQQYIAKVF